MIKNILVACLSLFIANVCIAAERMELFYGEVRILNLGTIERVAIGNPAVLSSTITSDGQLLLLAESDKGGITTLHLWFANGEQKSYDVNVVASVSNQVQRTEEVRKLLSHVKGLEVNMVGSNMVLSGNIETGFEQRIKTLKQSYPEILNNTQTALSESQITSQIKQEVEDLVSHIPGLSVRIVGTRVVISGPLDESYEEALATVGGAFPQVMDLTSNKVFDMEAPSNKMVLMSIKITEFNKSYTDQVGIAWDTSIAGPSAGGSTQFERSGTGASALGPAIAAPLNFANSVGQGNSSLGYFGIATEITSRINLAVNSGNAIILAQPRLAARSGGEATFLAGGEFPIQTSNINGTSITFKQHGIQLTVKPVVDKYNNVRASVDTELSAIDQSVAVDGNPGLITRKTTADVVLGSGETLVMSGLIDQQTNKDTSGLKYLSEIPILGALFRSKNFRDRKTELVIFVTPTVFDSESSLNQSMIKEAKQTFDETVEMIDEKLDIVY